MIKLACCDFLLQKVLVNVAKTQTKKPKPKFFKSPAEFRRWLKSHHKSADELQVGYYKKHTGKPSMTWPESVTEALCFGWIDGIRRSIDDERYMIRFTPRRRNSVWSAINVKMMAELEASGRMTAAGRAIFEARRDSESSGYTYEQLDGEFDAERLRAFKKNKAAWKFFQSQPPGYQRKARYWVMSAKREETRDRRLSKLVESCAEQKRIVG